MTPRDTERRRVARPFICLVTDRRQLAPGARTTQDEVTALEALIDDAVEAGVTAVQIREPDLAASVVVDLVRRVIRRRGAGPALVLINDRADLAIASGADGVHLRAASPPADRIRLLLPSAMIGRSVHSVAEVDSCGEVDYLLFGTVFPSASKPAGHRVAGLDALRRLAARAAVPVIAIGGIDTPERATACLRAGAAGVAAIGIFLPEGAAPGAVGARRAVQQLHGAAAH